MDALQRGVASMADDRHGRTTARAHVQIDQERLPTIRYASASLLPSLGGDERFQLRWPPAWRDPPTHPLLARAMHRDGDGTLPQELFDDVAFVDSTTSIAIQLARVERARAVANGRAVRA